MKLYDLNIYRLQRDQSSEKGKSMGLSRDPKNIAISASLVSILVFVTLANSNLLSRSSGDRASGSKGRGIASLEVESNAGLDEGWLTQFIQEHQKASGRSTASLGAKPTQFDQLRFGLLEGKYSLRVENETLKEIEFVETEGHYDRPKYINDKPKFLKELASLHKIQFDTATQSQTSEKDGMVYETYELREADAAKPSVGRAEFILDGEGRLRSLKLQEP